MHTAERRPASRGSAPPAMHKRPFPKSRFSASSNYDASEEDLTDTDPPTPSAPRPTGTRKPGVPRAKHHLAASLTDDGVDSPTYDGDVESSATVTHSRPYTPDGVADSSASASTLTSPAPTRIALPPTTANGPDHDPATGPVPAIVVVPSVTTPTVPSEPHPAAAARASFDPAKLTPEDIQAFVADAIAGGPTEKGVPRAFKINAPPSDRPVRIYADGVYDLFHFGHALQLRQAKLAFPSVYLMVGCNSDELVREHKSKVVMTHEERCEAIRHCRWVDEVVADAPWVITQPFLDAHGIDYVAHDEDPYAAAGTDDVYGTCKALGRFLPTRRTPGVSTSDLLERIVSQYRRRDFDGKLEKMGHGELKAAGSDYDDGPSTDDSGNIAGARARSRRRAKDPKEVPKLEG